MQWLIGSAALILSIILAFRYAESRRILLATLGIIAILAIAGATLFLIESQQSEQRQREAAGRITPAQVTVSGTKLDYDYGRWRLSGKLTNEASHHVTSLTLHVTVKDCPESNSCKVTGDTSTTHYGIDVPPGETQPFDMLLYLPNTPKPKAKAKTMQWSYEVEGVGGGQ